MNSASNPCPVCRGSRWLCEAHVPLRWRHDDCAAAGVPCVCRRGAAARGWKRIDSTRASSGREIDRRSLGLLNRRLVDRRAPGTSQSLPVERREGERRRQPRRGTTA